MANRPHNLTRSISVDRYLTARGRSPSRGDTHDGSSTFYAPISKIRRSCRCASRHMYCECSCSCPRGIGDNTWLRGVGHVMVPLAPACGRPPATRQGRSSFRPGCCRDVYQPLVCSEHFETAGYRAQATIIVCLPSSTLPARSKAAGFMLPAADAPPPLAIVVVRCHLVTPDVQPIRPAAA